MALSDIDIKARMEEGEIVISPFNSEDLGSASYDVRLGPWYYQAVTPMFEVFYNIYSERSTRRVWGKKRLSQMAADVMPVFPSANWENISPRERVILLKPHANLLCHTIEFIGARSRHTTMMKARSSIGRSLVNVLNCAGMGDVGYVNRWTMEIFNRSDWYIPLVVGRRIAQIVFLPTGPTGRRYASKYQYTDDVAQLTSAWSPELMLPRLDRDREVVR